MDAAKGISPMPVSRHFESKINKRISCVQCMATRDVVERFRDFSLDFQVDDREASALQRMINAYFDPEVLQVECDQCGASEALVRKELTKAPPRFSPTLETLRTALGRQWLQQVPPSHRYSDSIGPFSCNLWAHCGGKLSSGRACSGLLATCSHYARGQLPTFRPLRLSHA